MALLSLKRYYPLRQRRSRKLPSTFPTFSLNPCPVTSVLVNGRRRLLRPAGGQRQMSARESSPKRCLARMGLRSPRLRRMGSPRQPRLPPRSRAEPAHDRGTITLKRSPYSASLSFSCPPVSSSGGLLLAWTTSPEAGVITYKLSRPTKVVGRAGQKVSCPRKKILFIFAWQVSFSPKVGRIETWK